MTYSEWLERHPPIDRLVAGVIPPLDELEKLTFDAILVTHGGSVARTANAFGIILTDGEVEGLLERLVGVKEWPVFRREQYDLHC